MLKYLYVFIVLVCIYQRSSAQNPAKVEGLVIDYLNSLPLKNVNISIKGAALKNVNTKEDGTFSIEVPTLYSTLLVSQAGYQVKEASLDGKSNITVRIVPEHLYLGESIVRLPYNTINEKDLQGAGKVIFNSDDRARDLTELIQGKVAGLEASSYSGTPGEGVKFNLRGVRSLYTSSDPLVVLDGIPIYNLTFKNSVANGNIYNVLSDINVKDIESVTILKDASAAGIYGTRAANGVFVISTKEGTNGKTFLDVSMQSGVTTRFKELPMMSSSEYLPDLSRKLYSHGMSYQEIQSKFPIFDIDHNSPDYLLYGNNTNWQKEVSQNALVNDLYVNLRGGDATSKYSFQVGYNDAQGTIAGVSANRFTSRFNLDFKILKNFVAGTRISFSRTQKNLMDQGFEERVNPLYLSLVKPPVTSAYILKSPGVNSEFYTVPTFDNLSNPIAVVNTVSNEQMNFWILGSVYGQLNITKALSSKAVISLDQRGLEEDRFTPARAIVPMNSDPRFDRVSEQQMLRYQLLGFEHTLTYNKQLGTEHRVHAFGGYNVEISGATSIYGLSRHSPDDPFQALNDGTKVLGDGSKDRYHNLSAFANGEYGFREKVFAKAGLRLDGSSKFGAQAGGLTVNSVPFAVLPYASLSWRLKSEPWIRDMAFVDQLTLRSSIGLTANQDIPVDARHSLYGDASYLISPGLAPATIGNQRIRWETTRTYNGGADFSILRNALSVSFDYYNATTDDLLVRNFVDGAYGHSFYWGNNGSIQNRGVELSISTLGNAGNYRWNLGLNVAKYRNEVKSLSSGSVIDGINGYETIAKVGSQAGLIYGYRYLGVFSTTAQANSSGVLTDLGTAAKAGDVHYQDLNGDGMIGDPDRQVIGNPNPKWFGGLSGGLSYKNFDIRTLFSFSYGNDVLNVLRSKLENGPMYENQLTTALRKWTAEGDVTNVPFTAYGDPLANRRPSSNYIEDGSYLKMRTLSLAYHVTKQFRFIRNAQVYLTGYNLITLSNYSGWDPEGAIGYDVFSRGYDFGNVPQSRTFMLGLKLGL